VTCEHRKTRRGLRTLLSVPALCEIAIVKRGFLDTLGAL
jgi:hypothetical protein